MIKIQTRDFSFQEELIAMKNKHENIGAVGSFIGIVRDKRKDEKLVSMTLEHYPGMAEKMLYEIEYKARERWKLLDTLIIHRVGKLLPKEQIVLVITLSEHRSEALNACHFLIDWLKTKGPFWKYEQCISGGYWVEALDSDRIAEEKWK
tara:strand:+ start:307 stop:753 length:447 start_codon:yes stop_codon:yes gene_type:complete